jgi:hypothetical protein
MERRAAIHRPLRDGIAAQLAIFGVAPCPLLAVNLFIARRPLRHRLGHAALALRESGVRIADESADQ